jgi:hypothetical protein
MGRCASTVEQACFVILLVMVTTLLTPVGLRWTLLAKPS